MRVVHLNPFYHPYAGGIERRIEEVGRRLAKRHEVFVVTSQLPGTAAGEDLQGLKVLRLPSKFRFKRFYNPPIVSTPGLRAALKDLAPDVVDFHYRWSPGYARAFRELGGARVFTFHNTYGEGTGILGVLSRLNDGLFRRTLRRAHRIVCISRFIRDDLERRGLPAERLELVPNGIDAKALRKQAGPAPDPDPDLLVAVGRLVDTKGFDVAVRALPLLPGVRLTICGEGPRKGPLRRLASRLGVSDRVALPGWVPEEEKLRLLLQAVACVHPARFESFGMSVIEAMAMGAPILGTRVGGMPEVVGDGGILLDHADPKGLADAVDLLRSDPKLRADLSRRARSQADRFSWDEAARRLENVYQLAIDSAKT